MTLPPDRFSSQDPAREPGIDRTDWAAAHADLLKKIATLLTALVALALVSVILQVGGLIGANRTADEVSDRLDDIRSNTATP